MVISGNNDNRNALQCIVMSTIICNLPNISARNKTHEFIYPNIQIADIK